MASTDWEDEHGLPLRSINADKFALITFLKKTPRKIDIYWLNYQGKRVRYTTLDGDVGQEWPIMTFESHPWIFRDANTDDRIVAIVNERRQEVFRPIAWLGEERQTVITLDIPVYTLRERCIQEVRKLKTETEIDELYNNCELPQVLKRDLKRRPQVPFNDRLSVPSV